MKNRETNGEMFGWMHGQTDGRTDRQMSIRTNKQIDRWVDGQK